MALIDILVSGPHTIFSDEGNPLSPGFEYSVKDTPLIQKYASEGTVAILSAEKAVEDKTEKKPSTKFLTDQATAPIKTSEENSNG
jgi:hypothetical protein